MRLLRDQWYSVKIDNVNRTAVLNNMKNIKTDAIDIFSKENEVKIAKIVWLSDKLNGKAYGSILIYFVKKEDVIRLLNGIWFNAENESAYIKSFEYRYTPLRYYICQELGYMIYSKYCSKIQKCGKYAVEDHN